MTLDFWRYGSICCDLRLPSTPQCSPGFVLESAGVVETLWRRRLQFLIRSQTKNERQAGAPCAGLSRTAEASDSAGKRFIPDRRAPRTARAKHLDGNQERSYSRAVLERNLDKSPTSTVHLNIKFVKSHSTHAVEHGQIVRVTKERPNPASFEIKNARRWRDRRVLVFTFVKFEKKY